MPRLAGRALRSGAAAPARRRLPDARLDAEAEDAVQDAWLRLNRSDAAAIDNLGGWLTTVVARLSLDRLRSRKAQARGVARRDPARCPPARPGRRDRPGARGDPGRLGRARDARRARDAQPGGAAGLRPPRHVRAAVRRDRADRRALPDRDAPAREPRPAAGARRDVVRRAVPRAPARSSSTRSSRPSRAGDFEALLRVLDPGRRRPRRGPDRGRPPGPIPSRPAAARRSLARRCCSGTSPAARDRRSSTARRAFVVFTGDRPFAVLGFRFAGVGPAARIAAIDVVLAPAGLATLDPAAFQA